MTASRGSLLAATVVASVVTMKEVMVAVDAVDTRTDKNAIITRRYDRCWLIYV
jgi:hypothetical protein